jgi:hypothetical protein
MAAELNPPARPSPSHHEACTSVWRLASGGPWRAPEASEDEPGVHILPQAQDPLRAPL